MCSIEHFLKSYWILEKGNTRLTETKLSLIRDDENRSREGKRAARAYPAGSWLGWEGTPGLQAFGPEGLWSAPCFPGTCLPSFPPCEGDGKTTGSVRILRVEKYVIAFAERALRLSLFSLWELVGHLQKAWEEQLMKRSNSLENCLTLFLYFWISLHGQGLLRSWFPPEVSCLGMQWNLRNPEELGRRPAGIREWPEYALRTFRSIVFKDIEAQIGKELCPAPAWHGNPVCFIPHRALFGLLLNASNDRRLTIQIDKLFQKSFFICAGNLPSSKPQLASRCSYKIDTLLFPRWSLNIWRQLSCIKSVFTTFSSTSWSPPG